MGNVVAVIPASLGADAPAGVFLQPFAGRPLLAHSIEQARGARSVSRTVVATTSPEVARVARDWGAEIVSTDASSLPETLTEIERGCGGMPDLCVVLAPLSPLRTSAMIDQAVAIQTRNDADTVLSVHAVDTPLWAANGDGAPRKLETDGKRYAENGSITVVRCQTLMRTGKTVGERVALHSISSVNALRLNRDCEWREAEALYRPVWSAHAAELLRPVRLLALDFDGVMSDNRVIVSEDGREAVLCNRGDGMGLDLIRAAGIPVAVISKEGNPVVTARCRKLKLICVQGVGEKLSVLKGIAEQQGVALDQVAFMGNDVNDLSCMRAVAASIAPADSHPAVLREARLVTTLPGGMGAVREVTDLLLEIAESAKP